MEIYRDIEQGTPEWMELRSGCPTASEFSKVMAKVGPRGGTTHKEYVSRTKYMHRLAGEIITGEPEETYHNFSMERGKEREAEARDLYAFRFDVEPERVGFVRNGNCGCSPDSLLSDNGALEIKDAIPSVQIARLVSGVLPSEHKWQCHGIIMVCELDYVDFMSHCRGLPPMIVRVERDDDELTKLREGVDRFVAELDQLVKWIRCM